MTHSPFADHELERATLLTLLAGDEPGRVGELSERDFDHTRYRKTFQAIQKTVARHAKIDVILVRDELQAAGLTGEMDTHAFLEEVADGYSNAGNLTEYIAQLKTLTARRAARKEAMSFIEELPTASPDETLRLYEESGKRIRAEAMCSASDLDLDGNPIHLLTASEYLEIEIPPVEWIVQGYIPKAGLAIIYGIWGVGKSLLALEIATAVALGRQLGSLPVTQGRVLYLSLEDPPSVLKERLEAVAPPHEGLRDPVTPPSWQPDSLLPALFTHESEIHYLVAREDRLRRLFIGRHRHHASGL